MKSVSNLWEIPTELTLKRSLAGFHANMKKQMRMTDCDVEKEAIVDEYVNKIKEATATHYQNEQKTKLHNAAVKAVITRRKNLQARSGGATANVVMGKLKKSKMMVSNIRRKK